MNLIVKNISISNYSVIYSNSVYGKYSFKVKKGSMSNNSV